MPAPVQLPLRMNNVPHPRDMRDFFYDEVSSAVRLALEGGESRLSVRCTIPETNPEMDVYRIGTVLELIRAMVLSLVEDGTAVKVSVQQGMGEGVFQGLPLTLSGVRRIMDAMDWGDATEFVKFGEVGSQQIEEGCKYYILICPQNVVGSTIVTKMKEMVEKAEQSGKRVILFNPVLKDVPSAGGVMGVRGRKERMEFVETFVTAYHFRLLYYSGSFFPIVGALRYLYGGMWEVYKRTSLGKGEEEYRLIEAFKDMPESRDITQCIQKARQKKQKNRW